MTKNPKPSTSKVARKVGSSFLESVLSILEAIPLYVIAGIKHLAGLKRFIAKEDELDGRMMLRLGAWGVGSIVALVVAIIAVQSPASARRDQASPDVTQQAAQQLQQATRESQNQTRQLSAAMDTLNKDRDRLYNRVTVLEQALDSVNGSIAKLSAPPQPVVVSAAPVTPPAPAPTSWQPTPQQQAALDNANSALEAPIANTQPMHDTKPSEQKSVDAKLRPVEAKKETQTVVVAPMAPPKVAAVAAVAPTVPPTAAKNEQKPESAAKPEEKRASKPSDQPAAPDQAPAVTGSIASAEMPDSDGAPEKPVERTAFGVDLGGANSMEGLRALWRGLRGPHRELLGQMQPLVVIKERTTGRGTQLRLVAGPLTDAAAAAKLCATLTEKSKRASCEPSVYDGQRLAVNAYRSSDAGKADAAAETDIAKPDAVKTEAADADAAKPEAAKTEAPKKREAANTRRRVHVRVTPAPAPPPQAVAQPAPQAQYGWSLSAIFNRTQ